MFTKQLVIGVLVSVGVSACGAEAGAEGTFNYFENGADWEIDFPLCGTGEAQSPIDLTRRGSWATHNMDRQFWNYKNYPTGLKSTLLEHTIKTDFTDGVYKLR